MHFSISRLKLQEPVDTVLHLNPDCTNKSNDHATNQQTSKPTSKQTNARAHTHTPANQPANKPANQPANQPANKPSVHITCIRRVAPFCRRCRRQSERVATDVSVGSCGDTKYLAGEACMSNRNRCTIHPSSHVCIPAHTLLCVGLYH